MDSKKEMAITMRMLVGDFNENHDPETGQFTEGSGGSSSGHGAVNGKGTMNPEELRKVESRRDALWDKEDHNNLSDKEREELKNLERQISEHYSTKKDLENGKTSFERQYSQLTSKGTHSVEFGKGKTGYKQASSFAEKASERSWSEAKPGKQFTIYAVFKSGDGTYSVGAHTGGRRGRETSYIPSQYKRV